MHGRPTRRIPKICLHSGSSWTWNVFLSSFPHFPITHLPFHNPDPYSTPSTSYLIPHTKWDSNLFPTSLQHSFSSAIENPDCILSQSHVSFCYGLDPALSASAQSLRRLNLQNRLGNRELVVQLQSPASIADLLVGNNCLCEGSLQPCDKHTNYLHARILFCSSLGVEVAFQQNQRQTKLKVTVITES